MKKAGNCRSGVPLAAVLILSLLLNGCGFSGNRHRVEQLRPVEGLGYDRQGGIVVLSASAGAPKDAAISLVGTGLELGQAMDGLKTALPEGELFFPHTRYVVAGRKAAEAGLDDLLEYVRQDEALGLDMELLVLDAGTAEELVTAEDFDLGEALRSALTLRGDGRCRSTFRETTLRLHESGAAPVLLLTASQGQNGPALSCGGWGILRDGVLVSTVTDRAAEAAEALLGYSVTVTRVLRGCDLTYTLGPCTVRRTPRGALVSVPARIFSLRLSDAVAGAGEMRDALASALRRELTEVLDQAKSLEADWLGLRLALRPPAGTATAQWLSALDLEITAEVRYENEDDTV